MSDTAKVSIILIQPAKIGEAIRPEGWAGEVEANLADQLAEAGAIDRGVVGFAGLDEPPADPRDDLIARLQDDIGELRGQLEVASSSAALSTRLIAERDEALARTAELETRIAATEGERDEARGRVAELAKELAARPVEQPANDTAAAQGGKTKAATST